MMVQAEQPAVWKQEFARLSYEWEKVYSYGDAAGMCTDGVILNQIRRELLEIRKKLDAMEDEHGLTVPPEVPESFMACADEIRAEAQCAVQEYLAMEEYQYVQVILPKLTLKQKQDSHAMEISGKVMRLAEALAEDNLVVLREYGSPGMLTGLIVETAKKLQGLPLKQAVVPEKRQEDQQEDWQVEGQMSIYDLAVT